MKLSNILIHDILATLENLTELVVFNALYNCQDII
jgi:hypothetical protein